MQAPGSRGPDAQKGSTVKPTANRADMSDRSDDDALHLEASPAGKHVAHMAVRRSEPKSSQPRPSAKASASTSSGGDHRPVPWDLDVTMGPEKGDYVFPVGQLKVLTIWDGLHDQTNFHKWAKKNGPKSLYYWEWIQWVDRYFDVNEVGIFMRTISYYAPDSRVTRDSGRRKPPNPPKTTKCQACKDFTKQGPTGYTIRMTCLDCGHAETDKRVEEPTYPVDECPHKDVDYRGSSRTTHRVYW